MLNNTAMANANDKKPRIGLQLGSFNPPHYAHLHSAMKAREKLRLSEVWMMPLAQSPLKKHVAQATMDQKLDMCRLITAPHSDWYKVSDAMKSESAGYSGMLTACLRLGFNLAARHPDTEFCLIGGADNRRKFTACAWHMALAAFAAKGLDAPGKDTSIFHLALVNRLTEATHALGNFHVEISKRQPGGSSTDVRAKLWETNQTPESLNIPPAVYQYIKQHRLYLPG